jgi:predicted permease
MTRFLRRLRARIRYRHFDAELRQELDVHRAMAEDDLRAGGAAPDDARHLAARRLGNTLVAREAARGVWIAPWLESVWQDVRYATRSLRHNPGFTATAVLTLTLGVGLNTTLFSFADTFLLQPWRAPDAHRLVRVYHRTNGQLVGVSAAEVAFLWEHSRSVDLAGMRSVGGMLRLGAATRSARGRLVSANYFNVLRVPLVMGRGLQPGDERPGIGLVIVLGHNLWETLFAADAQIVGRTIGFRDQPVTVVGVAAPDVRESPLAGVPEFWMPLSSMPALFPDEPFAKEFMSNATRCCVDLVGRLHPGLSRSNAEAELSTLDRRFRSEKALKGLGLRVTGTEMAYEPEVAPVLPTFALALAAAALVLLLTCANVGNLQLARAAARRREVTIRLALGAARRRVVRQLLTEGLLLSVVATVICLAISSVIARTAAVRLDADLASALDFSISGRVLLFAAIVAVVACLITSLAPALRGTRHLIAGRISHQSGVRMRSAFLAVQVAISVVLLAAAALLGRGIVQAASQDVGFRLDTLMALRVERESKGRDGDTAVLRDVMAAIGKRHVAAAAVVPLDDDALRTEVRRAGEPYEANRRVRFHPVSSSYFEVVGIPLRSGRAFSDTAVNEVVLNETLARMLWPDGGAVGGYLAGPGGTVGDQVVGVTADAHIEELGAVGPMVFQPVRKLTYLLFNTGEIAPDELRAAVAGADPSAATTLESVRDNVESSLEVATLGAGVAGAVGVLALAIAAVGIVGVFSFAVTERTREVGIRLALGASHGRVRRLLLRRTGGPIATGLVIGLLLAVVAGLALRNYLYGLSPVDPIAYIAVAVIVVLMAWMATIIPMRRALRVDPAATLRHE